MARFHAHAVLRFAREGPPLFVLPPDGMEYDPAKLHCQQIDNALVKALARAFRWREMLETGKYTTVKVIADTENINASYVSRLLRLTLLAPNIVEAIIDGKQSATMTVATLMCSLPISWQEQRYAICR